MPFYDTKRMAAYLSRRLGRPVNRKLLRRIYKRMGWNQSRGASQGTRTRRKPAKASRPNQTWGADRTPRMVRARRWMVLSFQRTVYLYTAVDRIPLQYPCHDRCRHRVAGGCRLCRQTGLLRAHTLVLQRLPVHGQKIPKGASLLGINPTFIHTHTPEQNGQSPSTVPRNRNTSGRTALPTTGRPRRSHQKRSCTTRQCCTRRSTSLRTSSLYHGRHK